MRDIAYILYALKLKLWLWSNPVPKSFSITRLGHRHFSAKIALVVDIDL